MAKYCFGFTSGMRRNMKALTVDSSRKLSKINRAGQFVVSGCCLMRHRGGRECAFSSTDFAPLSRNYIMLVSHWLPWALSVCFWDLGFRNWNLVAYKEIMLFDISQWNNFLSNSIISIYATKFQFQIPKADGQSLSRECGNELFLSEDFLYC